MLCHIARSLEGSQGFLRGHRDRRFQVADASASGTDDGGVIVRGNGR
jgi:hypothetical protein